MPISEMIVSKPDSAAANSTDPHGSGPRGDQLNLPGYEYEVFLSFRGPDTRKDFISCLHNALVAANIRTFLDDANLQTGEEISANLTRAIAQSKISIPVFSENYASSKWCLNELIFMLECKNKQNQIILPVFYNVTARDVRHQTGSYESPFKKHEEKYDPKTVEGWRKALTEVGGFKGWESENVANGHHGQLIDLIVSKVQKELKKAHLPVTDTLVGIEDRVETIKGLLNLSTNDVRIVGIWGMGGIGKTTLAKVTYNQILDGFEYCSFLKDIRETTHDRDRGIGYVQSSLVSDLSRYESPPFKNVEEGINAIKDRYRNKKVLILLDDIDHTNQLDALVIRPDSFGQGSRIIITTRNRDVLDENIVACIYEAKEMDDDEALKLFYKCAFGKNSPTDELSDVSREIVTTTGGLPLALEVIGSFLKGKKRAVWEDTSKKLKRVPHVTVQDKLRTSYETLDYGQKQIFLDIACFFIKEDIGSVFEMWKDSKFFPEVGIDVLLALSLIKIREHESGVKRLWMHNQIRDFGREIIRQESYEDLRRSRLWRTEEARNVLENQKKSANVEAIRIQLLNKNDQELCLRSEQFKNLSNLRILDLSSKVRLDGDFQKLLASLRWFRWPYATFDSVTNLHLPNLVYLDLSCSSLTDDWKGWSSIKMMKLKILDLRGCDQIKSTPDFSAFPGLEKLILQNCTELQVIDPSIDKLKNMSYLNISSCYNIKELPHQLGSLEKLEDLNVSKCKSIVALPDLSKLKLLEKFEADECERLQELVGLDELKILKTLSISGCKELRTLPDTSKLPKLQKLVIPDGTKIIDEDRNYLDE